MGARKTLTTVHEQMGVVKRFFGKEISINKLSLKR
jgi:hypothetical protein